MRLRHLYSNQGQEADGLIGGPVAEPSLVSTNQLIIFVKAPRVGTVKTRLAASLGEAKACAAYKQLTETLLQRLEALPEIELRFSPDDAVTEIQTWLPRWGKFSPQGAGALGQRLDRAFMDAFARGSKRVVIIGSDCPSITRQDISDAWSFLENYDVVVGPACDGGYWLIGLRAPQPALFQQITWSTPLVLKETLARATQANLRVRLLRELSDVDTAEDWRRFLAGE